MRQAPAPYRCVGRLEIGRRPAFPASVKVSGYGIPSRNYVRKESSPASRWDGRDFGTGPLHLPRSRGGPPCPTALLPWRHCVGRYYGFAEHGRSPPSLWRRVNETVTRENPPASSAEWSDVWGPAALVTSLVRLPFTALRRPTSPDGSPPSP